MTISTPNVNPFFPVERQKLFASFEDEQVYVDRDGLLNAETGGVLGTVGVKYKLVPNAEVNSIFEEAFQNLPVEFTKDHLNSNESRWQRDIILDGDQFTRTIGLNDVVKTKISVWNGYDGRTGVGFALSAYRQICENGMMGWRKMFGSNLPHLGPHVITKIQRDFDKSFQGFQQNFDVWESMANQRFTHIDFKNFIESRVKRTNDAGKVIGYLSDRQADAITDQYAPILNKYRDDETRWASLNVITAIATHHTEAREGGSSIFSAGYSRLEKLAQDFMTFDANSDLFVVS